MSDVETHSIGLKSIREALDVRSNMLQNIEKAAQSNNAEVKKKNTTIVIVGAGPAGVEMAGAIAEFKKYIYAKDYPELDDFPIEIHLIEAGPKVLSTMTEKSSSNTLNDLNSLKIHIHLNTAVKSYNGSSVALSNGTSIATSSLIWTAGVRGQFPKGVLPDTIVRGNRINVDHFNRIQGQESVFAIGDVAFMSTEKYPEWAPNGSTHSHSTRNTFSKEFDAKQKQLEAFYIYRQRFFGNHW